LKTLPSRPTACWPNCRRLMCWCWAWAMTATPHRCSQQPEPGRSPAGRRHPPLLADAGAERAAPAPDHESRAAGHGHSVVLSISGSRN
jgi:hypothetical protein